MFKAVLAGVLAAIALAAIPTSSQAASGCFTRGPDRSRTFGNGIPVTENYHTWKCFAYTAGDVEEGSPQGRLNAGTSWFVCQKKWVGFDNPPVGSARNDWWLFTLADVAYSNSSTGGWGWFPATKIQGGSNWGRIPGNLPNCDTVEGSWVSAGPPYGP
jgi:hypothetical protein